MSYETLKQSLSTESFYDRHKAQLEAAIASASLLGIFGACALVDQVDLPSKDAIVRNVVNPIGRELFPIPGPADFDTMLTSITVPTPYAA